MTSTKECWDLGEEPSVIGAWPRHNKACLGDILYALVELNGKILSTCVEPGRFAKGKAPITMRIELPYGKKDEFEAMTGFPLTKPVEAGV